MGSIPVILVTIGEIVTLCTAKQTFTHPLKPHSHIRATPYAWVHTHTVGTKCYTFASRSSAPLLQNRSLRLVIGFGRWPVCVGYRAVRETTCNILKVQNTVKRTHAELYFTPWFVVECPLISQYCRQDDVIHLRLLHVYFMVNITANLHRTRRWWPWLSNKSFFHIVWMFLELSQLFFHFQCYFPCFQQLFELVFRGHLLWNSPISHCARQFCLFFVQYNPITQLFFKKNFFFSCACPNARLTNCCPSLYITGIFLSIMQHWVKFYIISDPFFVTALAVIIYALQSAYF